jgi:hypothetical protein
VVKLYELRGIIVRGSASRSMAASSVARVDRAVATLAPPSTYKTRRGMGGLGMIRPLSVILVTTAVLAADPVESFGRGSHMGFAPQAHFANPGFFPHRFFGNNHVFFRGFFGAPGFVVAPYPAYPYPYYPYPYW